MTVGYMQRFPGMGEHSETVRPAVEEEMRRLADLYQALALTVNLALHAEHERAMGREGLANLPPLQPHGNSAPELLEQIVHLRRYPY